MSFEDSLTALIKDVYGKASLETPQLSQNDVNALIHQVFGHKNKSIACNAVHITQDVLDKFKTTSANCIHHIDDDGNFIKVQLYDFTDPLINEVAISQCISKLNAQKRNIFTQYVDHYVIQCDKCTTISPGKEYQVLVTKALKNPKGLADVMRSSFSPQVIIKMVHNFLDKYARIAGSMKLIHNDMHLNNIVKEDGNDNLIAIDYGRSYLPENILTKFVDSAKEKYCLMGDYTSLISDNISLKKFTVRDSTYGWMCDIATLALNTAINYDNFPWPSWFSLSASGDSIILDKIVVDDLVSWYYMAFAFLNIFLRHRVGNVSNLKISDIYGNHLQSNGVFSPHKYDIALFHKALRSEHFVSDGTFADILDGYMARIQANPSRTGGNAKLTQIMHSLSNVNTLSIKYNGLSIKENNMLDQLSKSCNTIQLEHISKAMSKSQNRPIFGVTETCKQFSPFQMQTIGVTCGGAPRKAYKIHKERVTKRRYIMYKSAKWYLDSNKGRYIYTDSSKISVYVKSYKIQK